MQFLTASDVKSEKRFVYDGSTPFQPFYGPIEDPGYGNTGNTQVDVILTFNTGKESGLDAQLPGGVVRMYQPDVDGSLL